MEALLNDFEEYETFNMTQYTITTWSELGPPKSMYLTHDELQTIAVLSLRLCWKDIFQATCRLIVNRSAFDAGRVPKLIEVVGNRMRHSADISSANFLLGLCTKFIDIIKICEELSRGFKSAKGRPKAFPGFWLGGL